MYQYQPFGYLSSSSDNNILSTYNSSQLYKSILKVLLFVFLLIIGCHKFNEYKLSENTQCTFIEAGKEIRISIESRGELGNRVNVECFRSDSILTNRVLILPYDIYQFQVGDIDNDGFRDVCLGVIKACMFDSVVKKRLFIYSLDEGMLVPMWLGTYLGEELQNFRLVKKDDKTIIRTLEKSRDNDYLVRNYHWVSFGPEFLNHSYGGKDYEQAIHVFSQD